MEITRSLEKHCRKTIHACIEYTKHKSTNTRKSAPNKSTKATRIPKSGEKRVTHPRLGEIELLVSRSSLQHLQQTRRKLEPWLSAAAMAGAHRSSIRPQSVHGQSAPPQMLKISRTYVVDTLLKSATWTSFDFVLTSPARWMRRPGILVLATGRCPKDY